ncbi:MAG: hypothetical protein U0871_09505 [Gemmataceae bacterium]
MPDSPALDPLLADFDCGDWSDLPTDPGPPPATRPVPVGPADLAEPDPGATPARSPDRAVAQAAGLTAHRVAFRAAYGPLARLVGRAARGDLLARYECLWRDRLRALARVDLGLRVVLTPVSLEYALRCGASGRPPAGGGGKPVPCGRWFCPHCRYRTVRDVWRATAAAAATPGVGLWVDDRWGPGGPVTALQPFVHPGPDAAADRTAGPRRAARLFRTDVPGVALAAFVGRGPQWDWKLGWRYRWTAAGLTAPPPVRAGRPTPARRPGPLPGPRPQTVPASSAGWAAALTAAWGWPAWLLRAPVDPAAEVLEQWWNTRLTSRSGRLVRAPHPGRGRLIDANEPDPEPAAVGNSDA